MTTTEPTLADIKAQLDRIEGILTATKPPVSPPSPPDPGTDKELLDVIPELKNWTIMLPTGKNGNPESPENDYPEKLGTRPNVLFVGAHGGVVFRAAANGAHSKNSKYTRTEARQMSDTKWHQAAWPSSGNHSMECELSIDASHLSARKRVNGMQIHNGSDDVCQIMRHEKKGLGFMHNDGESWVSIDPNYRDGTQFTCRIVAADNKITVFYNGEKKVEVDKKGSGWFWKTGCYNQSGGASEHKEPAGAYGEVVLYRLVTTGDTS